MLKVVQLTDAFEVANPSLKEVVHDKNRGYGIVAITYKGLTFGIPLRTNLSHKNGVILDTIEKGNRSYNRGLDYTKAVLIRNPTIELGDVFFVSPEQKAKLITTKDMIINQFQKYVAGYVSAVEREKQNTLNGPMYRYSTLVNYHAELGLL